MENMTKVGMDGCERCPNCHKVPQPKVAGENTWSLECERHGHLAYGSSLEQVVSHWNTYIAFITKRQGEVA